MAFTWRPVKRPRWPWLLVAFGFYLVVVFGPRAWDVYPVLPAPREQLICNLAVDDRYEDNGCALAQWRLMRFERALIVVATGAAALLLGGGRLARPERLGAAGSDRALEPAAERRRARRPAFAGALAIWTFAEALLLPCCLLLLVVTCFTLIGALAQGAPPSGDVVNAAIERTLDAASVVIDALSSPPSVS